MAPDTEPRTRTTCPRCRTFLPEAAERCPICGWRLSETGAARPLPGPAQELETVRQALADDYDVLDELGRGGMAVVYRARERALARDVALKVLPLARAGDAAFVERFQREARTAAGLEHPHVIPIHRVGQVGSVNYFAMKYLPAPSLAEVLRRQGTLPPPDLRRMLAEVAEALGYAAGRGVVHRDIKPDNILVDETGRYVVTDFGIARAGDGRRLTETGVSLGTPRYMSPEQATSSALDGRSDIYSLGIVAYHCLVGAPPFDAPEPLAVLYDHVHTPIPRPALATDEERRLYAIVERMVAKDPKDRFQGGAEIVQALAGEPAEARPATAPRGPRRAPRLWAPATGGLVVLMALYVLLGQRGAARCREALGDSSGDAFAVVLDPIGTVPRGAPLEVSYDVCGLPGDATFTGRVTVSPAEGSGGVIGGVRRLFAGGPTPTAAVSFEDRADGFATRRTETAQLGDLAPGSYRLVLSITDARGRERDGRHDFVVVE